MILSMDSIGLFAEGDISNIVVSGFDKRVVPFYNPWIPQGIEKQNNKEKGLA